MNKFFILLIPFAVLLSASCHRKSSAVSSQSKTDTVTFDVRDLTFDYLITKSKVKFTGPSNELNLTVNSRIRKDSLIWLSISPGAGIEAVRALVRQDSVLVLDRLNNIYYAYGYSFFRENFGVEVNYSILEGLLLGNLPLEKLPGEKGSFDPNKNCYLYRQKFNSLAILNHIDPQNLKLIQIVLTDPSGNTLVSDFRDFIPLNGQAIAGKNQIKMEIISDTSEKVTILDIQHNKAEISEKELNFPFNVPQKYERK